MHRSLLLSTAAIALNIVLVQAALSEEACSALVDRFLDKRLPHLKNKGDDGQGVRDYDPEEDFIFFLHVPRTAGRSFWSCFLYIAYPPSKKCAKSYDSLRLELSRPDCKLLASHDDYSITDYLPDGFHVVTQARDPVDRVISAYEFAALVAARDFNPNITKAAERAVKVKTRDVWPWMYLIQLFDRYIERSMAQLFRRNLMFKQTKPAEYEKTLDRWVESVSLKSGRTYYYHRVTRESKWTLEEHEKQKLLPALDPYNSSLLIPLAAFVEFPMAEELVNNAMTYQVLGISNISYWPEATEIRECSVHSRLIQEKLLEAAKAQLDRMLHISLTDRLDESLQSIAATLKIGLKNKVWAGPGVTLQPGNETGTSLNLEDCRDNLESLSDKDLMLLLFKYRAFLDESRDVARSRRRSNLTKSEFLPQWDNAIANLESVREIQAEVMKRRKEKGENLTTYPDAPSDTIRKNASILWQGYQRCVNSSLAKMKHSKIRTMTNIALPDERRPYFTKQARKNIPQSTIDIIREKNWMDVELYKYALELYDIQLEYQKKHGLLEEIPEIDLNRTQNAPPKPPDPVVHDEL